MNRVLVTALAVGLASIAVGTAGYIESFKEHPRVAFADAANSAALESDGDVIESVSGNGHLVGGAIERTVTFNILKRADGSVEGWYHSLRRGPRGARIRVRVECLFVVGNQAWATGTVVAAVDPGNIGRPYSVRFVDNGEGSSAEPDEIGVARFVDYDCTTEADIPTRQLIQGNVQIRG